MKKKVAIVTGASSGIGLATAELFAQMGYTTYGLSRRKQGRTDFIEIQADVNDDESVKSAVAQVLKEQGQINVLVNNAGFAMLSAAEETSLAQVKAIFETNVFGVVRMTNAVLPIMRKQRSGRILHIGSLVGNIPSPYMAYYSSTKHAIEGYAESLDHEVRNFGIRSVVIEPGFMKTAINSHSLDINNPIEDYSLARESVRKLVEHGVESASSPDMVAKTVYKAAEVASPNLRYPVGNDAIIILVLRRFAPRFIFDKIFRSQFKLG